MIPIRDENPTQTFPTVTISLIVLNALAFIFELSHGKNIDVFITAFGAIPARITDLENPSDLVTLVSSLFLHGDFLHIIGNMLYLWIFGNNVEDKLGHFRFAVFYLVCGIAATLSHIAIAFNSQVPTIGASGAISGVLGAYFVLFPRAKVQTLLLLPYYIRMIKIDAKWFLLIWIGFQILSGTLSLGLTRTAGQAGVAWFAHIGGFFAGIFFLYLFLPGRRRPRLKDDIRDA